MIQYDVTENLKQFYVLNDRSVCPLIVGVTGHRDILAGTREQIKGKVRDTLKQLCRFWTKVNHRNDVPILVLNGMAEGADQLVAEVVLELKKSPKTQCLKLVSVLPVPWSEYRQDFDLGTELSAADALHDQADAEIVICNQFEQIEERYVTLAKILAHTSFLLLALWNGEEGKPGGTADVVRFLLEGTDPESDFTEKSVKVPKEPWHKVQPCGGVFQIVTPRESSPTQASNAGKCGYCTFQENEIVFTPGSLKTFLKKTDLQEGIVLLGKSNWDMQKGFPGDAEEKALSEKYLLDQFHPTKGGNLETLVRYYKEFDSLSNYYQKRKFIPFLKFYIFLAYALGLLYYVETLGPERYFWPSTIWHCSILDIVYYIVLVLFIGAFAMYYFWTPYYDIYHRYRAVAEALRVQVFWYMVNISEPVMNNYLNHPIPEMDWVRNTLNAIQLPICTSYDRPEDHPDMKYVYDRWLKDQKDFFRGRIQKHSNSGKKWSKISIWFGIMAFVWVIIRIWFSNIKELNLNTLLTASFTILLAMGGVWAFCSFLWSRFCCFDSQANRYRKMLPIYEQFCDYIAPASENPEEFPEVDLPKELYSFGKYALAENADWFLTQRKLTFPS